MSDRERAASDAEQPNDVPDVAGIEERLGLQFLKSGLLREALTHPSFLNEHPDHPVPDNQRLEFLGDAVLDLIVGEWLFRRYPEAPEGELTSVRAQIVRTETLASFAREIELGQHLRFGRGELSTGGNERIANLCAAFEAIVGAVYLDRGLEAARGWVEGFLDAHAAKIDAQVRWRDPKSRLQELVQGTERVTPSYRVIREAGPEHAKVFTAQVTVDGEVWGQGEGTTKQAAEQAAAAAALALHGDRLIAENPE
ncbi:MAG: ribonuclease III [Chloroflexi bacterium]|nr:ribonuclease III [Chloroflexota bacterium]